MYLMVIVPRSSGGGEGTPPYSRVVIFGSFFTFWGPNGLFLGLGKGPKTVLGSTHVVKQLSFSMLP